MSKGLSLHIAVNQPDPVHYGPNLKPLRACHNDANEMAKLARQAGFQKVNVLEDQQATLDNVMDHLDQYVYDAKTGDLIFLTYSGHGSQIPVLQGHGNDEDDKLDETWCLYDTQLIDTELYQVLAKFGKGVRIAILLDSCHSGTAIHEWIHESWAYLEDFLRSKGQRFRHVTDSHRKKLFKKHQIEYRNRQEAVIKNGSQKINASVVLISACQDNQRAIEDLYNGRFTSALLFETGTNHTYHSLHKHIHKHLHAFQSPNLYTLGLSKNKMLKQPFLKI